MTTEAPSQEGRQDLTSGTPPEGKLLQVKLDEEGPQCPKFKVQSITGHCGKGSSAQPNGVKQIVMCPTVRSSLAS